MLLKYPKSNHYILLDEDGLCPERRELLGFIKQQLDS